MLSIIMYTVAAILVIRVVEGWVRQASAERRALLDEMRRQRLGDAPPPASSTPFTDAYERITGQSVPRSKE